MKKRDNKTREIFIAIVFMILGAVSVNAQTLSIKAGFGGVLPIERSFASLELRHRIAPTYSLAIADEIGIAENNLMPKIIKDLRYGISVEGGFGWGHKWQKEGINDHNYEIYTLGINWSKSISSRLCITTGTSMFWRTYQGHSGFHLGSLRLTTGVIYKI